MKRRELKLTLPENLAREAEAKGLLQSDVLERLIRDEIRRRRVEGLFAAADRLAVLDLPALTEAEIEAEVEATRAERRADHARGA